MMSSAEAATKRFSSVLVANRGEIAVRVIAACQEVGIRALAVYSEADRNAAHVRAADEAYCIGPAPARESYLNIETIVRVARKHGADAIHPGYGFLSENANFAEACEDAGIVFIGPPPEAIRLMGSKTAAKRAVEAAGVPTVPGYAGGARDLRSLQREAARIGFPIMLKAASGGGGKGMRVVEDPSAFAEALAAAQREALAAFGDDSVFLEKLVVAPRHVEFQILADRYGNVIHLGERDCSIQRRHQKVVEESPCPVLSMQLREEMGAAAVRAAKAAGYVNAGTCEFLLDRDGHYYFLEMNTRLQVEHPVTELVTGVDLVRLQLAVAAGEPLPFAQAQIAPRGHAIEVRLYAEDPTNGYLPSTGSVLAYMPPSAPGLRIDSGVAAGDEVTINYDPMLAKVIVYGSDRPAAVQRLRWTLEHFAILGVATNLPLLRAIAAESDFASGETSTAYLDTHDLTSATQLVETPIEALLAAALWEEQGVGSAHGQSSSTRPFNPWSSRAALGLTSARSFRYTRLGHSHTVDLLPVTSDGGYLATIDGSPFLSEQTVVRICAYEDGRVVLTLGDYRLSTCITRRGRDVLVSWNGHQIILEKPRPLDVEMASHLHDTVGGHQTLVAPMAGTLIKVNVAEGDIVAAHQTLVILGAMKMEHAIVAPYPGRVLRVPHAAGDVVPGGETLVELEGDGD